MKAPLVLIEWEDSRQPVAAWSFLGEQPEATVVYCVSVGWLIHDGDDVKAVAPNMGDVLGDGIQVSGVIQIPSRCVVKVTKLKEPGITSPSSRPARGLRQRASGNLPRTAS